MSEKSIFTRLPDDRRRKPRPASEVLAEHDRRLTADGSPVVLTRVDMAFGEMVKTAFFWLLAVAIASIPFTAVGIVVFLAIK